MPVLIASTKMLIQIHLDLYIWPASSGKISMHKTLRIALTLALSVAPFAMSVMAQPVGGPPPCWPPPCIPIDGGVSALMVAGVILGGRKAMQLRKARKHEA